MIIPDNQIRPAAMRLLPSQRRVFVQAAEVRK